MQLFAKWFIFYHSMNIPDDQYEQMTSHILKCCFDVMNELGIGYLEGVYKNSLCIALRQEGLKVEVEKLYEIMFRDKKVGCYKSDIIVNETVIVELKACKTLLPEHKAQVINYLVGTGLPVALLVNFANKRLEYKRLYNPNFVVHPAGAC